MQEYEIKLDFISGDNDPEKLFIATANAIKYFKTIDNMLAKTLSKNNTISTSLISVEHGSLRSYIRTKIEGNDDELQPVVEIQDIEERIQNYLHQGRKKITQGLLEFKESEDIKELVTAIETVAKSTGVNEEPFYALPSEHEIMEVLDSAEQATETLDENTRIYYRFQDDLPVELPKRLQIEKTLFQEEEGRKTVDSERLLILKVKKPDFLGDSRWEMKHGRNTIICKIEDKEWITKFKNKKILVFPGDSLECNVKIIEEYDPKGNLIKSDYQITEVLNVIQGEE
jgi:hypothetical protein